MRAEKETHSKRSLGYQFFLGVIIFLLDKLSKILVTGFSFPYSLNYGISLGLFSNYSSKEAIIFLSLFLIVFYCFGREFNLARLLILAGGTSNLLDRFFWGGIVDWIKLPFWPTMFNIADLGIVVGVILIINSKFKMKNLKLQLKI